MYFERKIYKGLIEQANQPQETVITGLRRMGKTTLVKKLLSEYFPDNSIYFDLERLDNRNLFNSSNYEDVLLAVKQLGINFVLNSKDTFEVKETATPYDLQQLVKLSKNIDISNYTLISNHPPRNVENVIWGGQIK